VIHGTPKATRPESERQKARERRYPWLTNTLDHPSTRRRGREIRERVNSSTHPEKTTRPEKKAQDLSSEKNRIEAEKLWPKDRRNERACPAQRQRTSGVVVTGLETTAKEKGKRQRESSEVEDRKGVGGSRTRSG
jgi:hypothetical protein